MKRRLWQSTVAAIIGPEVAHSWSTMHGTVPGVSSIGVQRRSWLEYLTYFAP